MAHFQNLAATIPAGRTVVSTSYVDRDTATVDMLTADEELALRVVEPFGGMDSTLLVNIGGTFGASANLTAGQVRAAIAALQEALPIMERQDAEWRESHEAGWF